MFKDPPSVGMSLLCLSVAIVVSLAAAVRVVERREYVLEQ
jgi:hypothetical protein